jgi:hypothetical protein
MFKEKIIYKHEKYPIYILKNYFEYQNEEYDVIYILMLPSVLTNRTDYDELRETDFITYKIFKSTNLDELKEILKSILKEIGEIQQS